MKKYDVGIYGLWYGNNYGSMITYYALSKIIESMGKTYAMIKNPLGANVDVSKLCNSHPLKFAAEHYQITPLYPLKDMSKHNDMFDTFLIGSDQMWNYFLSKGYKQSYFLDFADDNKNKIAYGCSFGHQGYDGPESEKALTKKNLARFNAVSVRDNFSQSMCKDIFGIDAALVYDPVFLCPIEHYESLISDTRFNGRDEAEFIFAYILDPNPKIGKAITNISIQAGKKLRVIFDQLLYNTPHDINEFYNLLGVNKSDNIDIIDDPSVNEWLYCFKNAEFVLTDSFHGCCFSVIFKKPFIVMKNNKRGGGRFPFLLGGLGLLDRMVESPEAIYEKFCQTGLDNRIDYEKVYSRISEEKDRSVKWLSEALKGKIKNLPIVNSTAVNKPSYIESLHTNPDFKKIRILATLLRDYGVKHIVLSPGGRDVPLVRMFEYNDESFILHRVTDERSAAYFGMGIATQLRQPVACVCTSGTAASNYLPAVTEAYYTGIPLIVITADRYSVYHEQGEDQTIPQSHIYDGVVKKSVTVPEWSGYQAEYQARRDISDCILETTHNSFGPTHINIAVDNITVGAKAPREAWKLLPKIYPHILRVSFNNGEKKLTEWVDAMKRSPRILVVYGQNPPASQQQKNDIEVFAKKYNCVIVTDFISNLDCAYSLKPYNMLQAISQQEFNSELSPDILITVGGKRLMNDPLTFKVRHGLGNIRHWSVTPDGKIKDFYFRLSSVIEMSQDRFFEWFSKHAGDITNNGQYYENWRHMTEKYGAPEIKAFNAHYVQSRFFPAVPANSILHLGVGQSFYDCRRYSLDKTVATYCNMGTNGIDGCTSTFMGQCSVVKDRLCFLMVGDLSFFYDMNSIWNKELSKNIRILMVNNNGSGLLRGHGLKAVSSVHNTAAKGWVESTGFEYISAKNGEEYQRRLEYFVSDKPQKAVFFEVFCE